MEFKAGRKSAGWYVIGIDEDGDSEPWTVDLANQCIAKTDQGPALNMHMVTREQAEAIHHNVQAGNNPVGKIDKEKLQRMINEDNED